MTKEEITDFFVAALNAQQKAHLEMVERIEVLIKAEREECAKVCDARVMGDNNREDEEAKRCAAAIRARGRE